MRLLYGKVVWQDIKIAWLSVKCVDHFAKLPIIAEIVGFEPTEFRFAEYVFNNLIKTTLRPSPYELLSSIILN